MTVSYLTVQKKHLVTETFQANISIFNVGLYLVTKLYFVDFLEFAVFRILKTFLQVYNMTISLLKAREAYESRKTFT